MFAGIVTLADIAHHTQEGNLLDRLGAAGVTKTLSAVSESPAGDSLSIAR